MRLSPTIPAAAGLLAWALMSPASAVDMSNPIRTEGEFVSPEQVPGATTIQPERAHELWKQDVPFIDPRTPADFQVGHIPGPSSSRTTRTGPGSSARAIRAGSSRT